MQPDPAPWRAWDTATREREYSPSSCIGGNYRRHIDAYAARSAAARARFAGAARLDLPYGSSASQRLDLFVPEAADAGDAWGAPGVPPSAPAPGASRQGSARRPPLLVFIHGGYWQELSKNESAFAAADALGQGLAFAALDYTLAPAATVAAMVAECRQALAWLHAQAGSLGFDPGRIVVAGSSAGAHLAAMCALPDTPAAPLVRGAVLVSGIYEVEPLVGTSINDALGLDTAAAREVSPALATELRGFPSSVVCWGEVETAEFKRQGHEFAARLQRAGSRCDVFEVPGRNHFDVILELADPATRLGAATQALVGSI